MPQPIDVVLVTSPGCNFCDEVVRLLEELAETRPLRIKAVPLGSEQGRGLLVRYRVPFPPILIIDGELFGYGRISRRKLAAHLASAAPEEGMG